MLQGNGELKQLVEVQGGLIWRSYFVYWCILIWHSVDGQESVSVKLWALKLKQCLPVGVLLEVFLSCDVRA